MPRLRTLRTLLCMRTQCMTNLSRTDRANTISIGSSRFWLSKSSVLFSGSSGSSLGYSWPAGRRTSSKPSTSHSNQITTTSVGRASLYCLLRSNLICYILAVAAYVFFSYRRISMAREMDYVDTGLVFASISWETLQIWAYSKDSYVL